MGGVNTGKESEAVLPVRTEQYAKRRGSYEKTPNGWDGQNDGNGKQGHSIFHLPPPSQHDQRDRNRTQRQYPIDRKHRKRECPGTVGMFDRGGHRVGFDFDGGLPAASAVGKTGLCLFLERRCGEIDWSGAADCEHRDRNGSGRALLEDEGERPEVVSIEWGAILIAYCYLVLLIEGNRTPATE